MLRKIIRKIYNNIHPKIFGNKSEPHVVYKTWREITSKLVSQDYFKAAGLYNVWASYPGKRDRQVMAIQSLQNVISNKIPGAVAEFGCFKGHTAIQIAHTMEKMSDRSQFFLFDSFQGVPASTHPDDSYWQKGALTAEYSVVKMRFAPFKNVEIVKGYFKDVLPSYSNLRIKFAHVDADLYVSIKEVNEWLLGRMELGGIIIYDDYDFETCPGAMKAVDEDLAEHTDFYKWYLPTGKLMAVKI